MYLQYVNDYLFHQTSMPLFFSNIQFPSDIWYVLDNANPNDYSVNCIEFVISEMKYILKLNTDFEDWTDAKADIAQRVLSRFQRHLNIINGNVPRIRLHYTPPD